MYFGHKYVETGPNCSQELATFLKYHMSLNKTYTLRYEIKMLILNKRCSFFFCKFHYFIK